MGEIDCEEIVCHRVPLSKKLGEAISAQHRRC